MNFHDSFLLSCRLLYQSVPQRLNSSHTCCTAQCFAECAVDDVNLTPDSPVLVCAATSWSHKARRVTFVNKHLRTILPGQTHDIGQGRNVTILYA